MATSGRPGFLDIALRLFAGQSGANTELVVVGDGLEDARIPGSIRSRVTLVPCLPSESLGARLNDGVERARAQVVAKMDDDDFYAERYLRTMLSAIARAPESAVGFVQPFTFLRLNDLALVRADEDRCSGATLTFRKSSWRRNPFREVRVAVDAEFLIDNGADASDPTKQVAVDGTGLFLQTRHCGPHLWATMPWGEPTDAYVARMPRSAQALEQVVPAWLLERYQALSAATR